eukprot:TRINITY_DN3940_c0_g1_i1.p1 TRINITY_DN3940_c0_g1~~TRINITY_DN3940_c0_g1_i1.p1  ORF type:complete len:500 (+),score=57.90 TRINITY_DN3940_c0_g1_i1:230-1729(+)
MKMEFSAIFGEQNWAEDGFALLVSVLLLFTAFAWRKWSEMRRSGSRNGLPPGRMGWPFIGETLEFISCGQSCTPESFMDRRKRLYGKVFKSHLLGSPTIVSIDPEVSKAVLQNDGKLFIPSYPKSINELMGRSSILMLNGNVQKKLHGVIGSFLKSAELKEQITVDMRRYVMSSVAQWKEGQIVYLQEEAKSMAFQVLLKTLMSLNPGQEMEHLRLHFREFSAGFVSLPVKLPGTRLFSSLQAKAKMLKTVKTIMLQKRQAMAVAGFRPKDVMEVLLSSPEEEFTVDLITDNIIDLMIPGEDSVPMLITLAVKYLSDCPASLQQLREENMKMKQCKKESGQCMTWSDYMSMPFTQNVITETLRLGNIITGVMRRALQDVEIKGNLIPKGWCVFAYFRSIHLDEELYESPYKFSPWRWQEKDATGNNFTPFGGGQRLCPGLEMARLEASIFLHHLVTECRWEAEEDTVVSFPTVRMRRGMPIRLVNISDDVMNKEKVGSD